MQSVYRIYDTIEKIHRDDMFISAQGLLYRFVGYEVESIVEKDRYIVERCTGLYDKNKVLIYENDIVNPITADYGIGGRRIVEYDNGEFNLNQMYFESLQIIGHRFRDSHLLEH